MAGLQYTHPADDYVAQSEQGSPPSGILTASTGTPLAGYGVENLGNEDPAIPFKIAEESFGVTGDLGESKLIGLVVLVHPNFDVGLPLRLELDDDPGFGSPLIVDIEADAYQEDGFPPNAIFDLAALDEPIDAFRYFRVSNTDPNSVPISIGELIVCAGWRELPSHFQVGGSAVDDEEHPTIRNSTDSGLTTKYSHGVRRRWVRGDILDTNAQDDELIRRWNRAAFGDFRPFLINPLLPINEPWYVSFEASRLPRKRLYRVEETGLLIHGYSLGFEEIGRGKPPQPAPTVLVGSPA